MLVPGDGAAKAGGVGQPRGAAGSDVVTVMFAALPLAKGQPSHFRRAAAHGFKLTRLKFKSGS